MSPRILTRTQRARKIRRVIALFCALAMAPLFVAAPSQAGTTRVTEGDAQAVFEAVGNGGIAIIGHQMVIVGSPAPSNSQADIRPLTPWDGRHFCADDWHVILMALLAGGDEHFTAKDAEAQLATFSMVFYLDGTLLPTARTPLKPFLDPDRFGFQIVYDLEQGTLMAPSALSVGQHIVSVQATSQYGTEVFTIQIFIDPSGTGACL